MNSEEEYLKAYFKSKHCLVTGGTGLIGREVVNYLLRFGAKVKTVSLDTVQLNSEAVHVYGDLRSYVFCQEVMQDVDYVFHIAGIKASVEITKSRPASFFVPLLQFNTNVLEAARQCDVGKLVYTSSIGAYASAEIFVESEQTAGGPMDMYPGWAKRMAELQIKAYKEEYGIDWSIVRPCNVYGPGDNFDPNNAMVVPSLMMRIKRGENPVIIWGDGTAIRDFAFSRDVAFGIIQALVYGTRGDFVNLGSGTGYSIRELVEILNEVTPFSYSFDDSKQGGFKRRVMDLSRAREWINYSPKTSLRDGLRETWEWFLSNQHQHLEKKNYFA